MAGTWRSFPRRSARVASCARRAQAARCGASARATPGRCAAPGPESLARPFRPLPTASTAASAIASAIASAPPPPLTSPPPPPFRRLRSVLRPRDAQLSAHAPAHGRAHGGRARVGPVRVQPGVALAAHQVSCAPDPPPSRNCAALPFLGRPDWGGFRAVRGSCDCWGGAERCTHPPHALARGVPPRVCGRDGFPPCAC